MDTNAITFEITYALSDEYRQQQFEETGEQPKRKQTFTVDSTDLSPTARKRLMALPGGRSSVGTDSKSTRRLMLPMFKFKSRRRVAAKNQGRRRTVRLDDYPVLREPSVGHMTSNLFALNEPLTTETIEEALEKRVEQAQEIRREYEQALDETGPRLIGFLEAEIGHDGDRIPPAAPVLKNGILEEFEETTHHARLQELQEEAKTQNERRKELKQRRKEERRRQKQEKREQRQAEKEEWIKEYGSETLQKAHEAGYDCQRRYAIERVKAELGDAGKLMYVDFDETHTYEERSCPSRDALDFAESIDAKVVWLTQPGTEAADTERGYGFEPCEAVIKSVQLGEHGRTYTAIREF